MFMNVLNYLFLHFPVWRSGNTNSPQFHMLIIEGVKKERVLFLQKLTEYRENKYLE